VVTDVYMSVYILSCGWGNWPLQTPIWASETPFTIRKALRKMNWMG